MRSLIRSVLLSILIICFVAPLCACGAKGDYFVEFSLSEKVYVDGKELSSSARDALEREIAQLLHEIEEEVSVETAGGDVARINAAAAGERIEVGEHTAAILGLGLSLAEATDGAFSPALYALTDLWGFSPRFAGHYGDSRPSPSAEAIGAALAASSYTDIVQEGSSITKTCSETKLDFGGIAKGYMSDVAAQAILQKYAGHTVQCTLTVMSNSVLLGSKSGSALGYTASVENPRAAITEGNGASQALFAVGLSDVSVATSADNYRFYVYDGSIYKHIIDPSTGAPSQNGVISITVFVPNSVPNAGTTADALSTAGFCMPLTRALAFYGDLAETLGIGAIVITADFRYYVVGDYTVLGRTEYDDLAGSPGYFSEEVFTRAQLSDAQDEVIADAREAAYIEKMGG